MKTYQYNPLENQIQVFWKIKVFEPNLDNFFAYYRYLRRYPLSNNNIIQYQIGDELDIKIFEAIKSLYSSANSSRQIILDQNDLHRLIDVTKGNSNFDVNVNVWPETNSLENNVIVYQPNINIGVIHQGNAHTPFHFDLCISLRDDLRKELLPTLVNVHY